GTPVPLQPGAFASSTVYGIWANQQVGAVAVNNTLFAALWSGSADSFVNLGPRGSGSSIDSAMATDGAQQVGTIHGAAALWRGTAASYVDLDTSGLYPLSFASGVWNDVQVGYSTTAGGGIIDALEWRGTARSMALLRH